MSERREVTWISSLNTVSAPPCSHVQELLDGPPGECPPDVIPGLDAIYCKACSTYFVDQWMRDRLVPPKESSKAKPKAEDRPGPFGR